MNVFAVQVGTKFSPEKLKKTMKLKLLNAPFCKHFRVHPSFAQTVTFLLDFEKTYIFTHFEVLKKYFNEKKHIFLATHL